MFEVKSVRKDIVVSFKSKPLISLHTAAIKGFVEHVPAVHAYLSYLLGGGDSSGLKETDFKVEQFEKAFFKARDVFYGRAGKVRTFKGNSKNRTKILEAISIADEHNIDYTTYISAQVLELKDLSLRMNQKIDFPSLGHLAGENAEKRLLDYLRKQTKGAQSPVLTKAEQETPLKENNKFMRLWDKFNADEKINLQDALYLEACFKVRKNNQVPSELEQYINSLISN